MASSSENIGNGGDGENGGTSIRFFNHFDVVAEAKDHHYYLKTRKIFNNANAASSSVYAKIMKEWKILEKNLPESIYVQVYETRIDLLRAVIIGSPGTPYHDGLFFFDIMLPSNYPHQPPNVYYHSHGYRLNPNLYASGFVCLSLINTWSGRTDEMWSNKSTILQVLVSIQGLVLNDRPYFNEPGFSSHRNSKTSKWIKASHNYNEDVFIKSCSTMLHIIKKPPMNFEDFVVRHFRERASSILAAIHHYQEGRMMVGQSVSSSSSSSVQVSSKFKGSLRNIQPKLNTAFASFISEPNKENPSSSSSATTSKNAKKEKPSSSSATTSKNAAKKVKSLQQSHENLAKPKPKTGLLGRLISFVKKMIWK